LKQSIKHTIAGLALAIASGPAFAASMSLDNTFALDNLLAYPDSNFHPQGLGYDTGSNELLFMQQSSRTIYRTDLSGNINGSLAPAPVQFRPGSAGTSTLNYTTSVAGDGTNYYFSDYTNNTVGYDLYSADKTTGTGGAISSEVAGYGGYPIDVRDGKLYRTQASTGYNWTNLNQIRISSIATPDSITQTLTLTGSNGIGDIAVDSANNNVWTIDYTAGASVRRFDLSTGALLDTFALGLDGLTGGITYADNKLYYYDWNDGSGSTLSVYSLSGIAAVPVPASLPLLAGALGIFGFVGARRQRKSKQA